MHQRRSGAGSIYQRKSDGRWCASLDVGEPGHRRRRVVTATSEVQVRKRAAMLFPQALPLVLTRSEMLVNAKVLGSHTAAEVAAKHASHCVYCGVSLNLFNEVQDHVVPLTRGGSDAASNIQWICWQCNAAKGQQLEYRYIGAPRSFVPHPSRRRMWHEHIKRMGQRR